MYKMMYNRFIMKKISYISSNSAIMKGALVISGTRIPLVRILYLLKEGYTLEQVQKEYPQVSINTFKGVINQLANQINRFEKDDNPFLQA